MDILEARKVGKRFGGLVAVRDFDMVVRQGEIVGLIGPNGAGKTTLFNLCACYYPPTSGEVLFEGRSLQGLKPYHIAKLGMARTFQVTRPFMNNTVLENVMVGAYCHAKNTAEARAVALKALATVEFGHRADVVASELTVPDRKRLELARALATGPKLLLVDEVMAGLNPTEKSRLLDILRKLRGQGITLVVVEHDMKAVMSLCDRIVLLHRGEKLVEGTPTEVARDSRAVAAYLGDEYATA